MRLRRLRQRLDAALGRLGFSSGILMYHRVAREAHDPWNLCVSPGHFEEQMEFLRRSVDCVALGALGHSARFWSGRRVRIAVTFDDGYRDNLEQALPILERHSVPATIFVVSGQVSAAREFWWDALERCILGASRLPSHLTLTLGSEQRQWSLEAGADRACDPGWRADEHEARTDRQRLFLELWQWMVGAPADARERALDALMQWSGVSTAPARERLPLDAHELAELAKHPLIEVGCHTRGHARLTNLTVADQRREIRQGRDDLEALLGRPVTTFSYPYGACDRASRAIVRDAAFQLACTSRPAAVTATSRRYALPRLQVIDQDGARFAHWLAERFPTLRRESAHG